MSSELVFMRETSWVSRRGQWMHSRFPQFHCFWKIFKHPISRQLKQRSQWRKEEENNRRGRDGERERARGRNGLVVGDTALECRSGFNYRQRNSLFKYLEYRWSLWLCVCVCVRQALHACVCVFMHTLHTCVCALPCENLFVCTQVVYKVLCVTETCLHGDRVRWRTLHVLGTWGAWQLHVDAAVNV